MIRVISNLKFQIAFFVMTVSSAFAGARIDLRPTPPVPNGGYQPGAVIHVDTYLVDTGNAVGEIHFQSMSLDFTDSSSGLQFPGPDATMGTDDDGTFTWWTDPWGIDFVAPELPLTWWGVPLPSCGPAPWRIVMPDEDEVWIGDLFVKLPDSAGVALLDARNADEPNFQEGATATPTCGMAGGDPFTWRAHTGELTGGVLELPVIPEPTSCLLLAFVASALFVRKRATR